jgi:hypothetical protein
VVSNLNADLLDGYHASAFQLALTNPVTGTGTTNYLPKFTGTSTIGNSLIYDNGTNVGIGTTSPNEKLTISGSLSLGETSAPSATTGYGKLYASGADSNLYYLDDSGTSYNLNKVKQLIQDFVVETGESVTAGDIVSFIKSTGKVKKGAYQGYGSENVFNSAITNYVSAAALSSTSFVVAYSDDGNGDCGTAVIGTVSGTTISYGSEYVFNSTSTDYISVAVLSSTSFVVAYRDFGNSYYGTAVIGTVSGTTISYGSEYVFNSAITNYVSAAALSSTSFVVAYSDDGNSDRGTAVISGYSFNTVGIAKNSATAGQTVSVINGGVSNVHSGLTTGDVYYANSDGSLTTTVGNYRVGLAISATEILLDSNRNNGDQFFGDLVFANNFRVTEALGPPQGLIFKNQFGQEIMGLDENGYLGIGTTSPSEKLTVYNGSTTGTYTTSGWVHSSDARLKTNVGFIENPLSKVLALQGVYFNWKNNPDSDRQIGLIAQETLKVVPEAVVGNEEDGYGIAYGNLSALLIEAIKEQQNQFISYQSSITNKFSTINNSITHLDLSFRNLDLRMSDYDNAINRLTLETAYNSIKTANLENSVLRQNRDMQTENLYDFSLGTKEVTTNLSDSKFGEEGFSGTYTGEGEYQEIVLQLEDGDDLSNLENSKGFLEYEIYFSDADVIINYHTELGNEMDKNELQWDKKNHPYFVDGWNKISLLTDEAKEAGEIDWTDVDYFRTYFKFSGDVEIKIRKLAFRAYEKPTIQIDDYFAIDLETYNLTDQLDQARAIKIVAGQTQANRQAIEEWKQSQEEEMEMINQTINGMNDFDQMILDVVNSHEERIAVLEGQVATLLGGESSVIFGGEKYFSLDPEGNLVVDQTIKAPAIETQTVSAAEYKLKENQDQSAASGNVGSVIIYTGQQEVFVANDKVMYNSKIIVTPVGSDPVNWVVSEKTDNQGFKIRLSQPAGFDIAFDYWIVGVE